MNILIIIIICAGFIAIAFILSASIFKIIKSPIMKVVIDKKNGMSKLDKLENLEVIELTLWLNYI